MQWILGSNLGLCAQLCNLKREDKKRTKPAQSWQLNEKLLTPLHVWTFSLTTELESFILPLVFSRKQRDGSGDEEEGH